MVIYFCLRIQIGLRKYNITYSSIAIYNKKYFLYCLSILNKIDDFLCNFVLLFCYSSGTFSKLNFYLFILIKLYLSHF